MKSDSTKKSVKKSKDEVKTLDKKKAKKEIVEEPSNEKQLAPEKKIDKDTKILDLEEYPSYLENLLKQSDWIKQHDNINVLKNDFENKFNIILEEKKIEFINNGGNEIDFYFNPSYKK